MINKEHSDCIFNISGGNVQVLPNATTAIQNVYNQPCSEEDMLLAPYIHNLDERHNYVQRIKACPDSTILCKTVLADLYNDVLADCINSRDLVKSKEFINAIKPLLPFECGVEALRAAIRKHTLGETE